MVRAWPTEPSQKCESSSIQTLVRGPRCSRTWSATKMNGFNTLRRLAQIPVNHPFLLALVFWLVPWDRLPAQFVSLLVRWLAFTFFFTVLVYRTVQFAPIHQLRRAAKSVGHDTRWRITVALWRMRRMMRLSGHQTGASPPQAATARLAAVAPILLQHYLAHTDCLALWRTSHAWACLVWQHAPCVRLSLSGGILARAPRPWGGASNGACLAALIVNSMPPACIPRPLRDTVYRVQRINALALSGMQLSVDELRAAALEVPHLHTLALQACNLSGSTGPHPPPMPALRSLECTSCQCPGTAPLAVAVSLCNQPSLLHLTTDDLMVCLILNRLSSLQRLTITTGQVTDGHFDSLLRHPQLREVCVRRLDLSSNYRNRPCSWRQLRVLEHATVASLAALPLQGVAAHGGIQRCIVQQYISLGPSVAANTAVTLSQRLPALYNVRSLVFEPAIAMQPETTFRGMELYGIFGRVNSILTLQDSLGLGLDEAGFEVCVDGRSLLQRPLLQLAARHLVGGTLVIGQCDLENPRVLRALQQLSPAVTAVSFRRPINMPSKPRTLFTHLPQHVTRLVVKDAPVDVTQVYHRGSIATNYAD